MKTLLLSTAFVALFFLGTSSAQTEASYTTHAITSGGDPKYGPDFEHFDYVEPDAPKGGELRLAAVGSTFDTLSPFTTSGVTAAGQSFIGASLTYDALMAGSQDESSVIYPLLAETIEIAEDNTWVQFTLHPDARWHDGEPVDADDVIFSHHILTTEGAPFYASYFENVAEVVKVDDRTVRFNFSGEINEELPFIVARDLPILPQHYWEGRDFAETTLEPPLGSGPYRIADVDPGRSITYERVEDYWGRDLPVNVGQHNFGTITYDYYRDNTVALEALKSYEYDFRTENSSQLWATAYDVPAVDEGDLILELVPDANGQGMQAFWFNLRRDKFSDPRVREALGYAFDFEWSNENLFYGQYTRTDSFFSNSELASSSLPEGRELEILEPFRGRVPDEVFSEAFSLPTTDGSGNLRENLSVASDLLSEAGWEVQNGVLTNTETGERMEIEFLLVSPAFERIVAPFIQNLERLGVQASLRTVDSAQYQNRLQAFDFDVIVNSARQSLRPGNEQRDFWSSEAADIPGSRNLGGIQNPVVDELIEMLIASPDRETLVATTRALDRVLLWNQYVIPQWYLDATRVAYWDKFGRPEGLPQPTFGFDPVSTWWVDESKLAELDASQ